MRMVFLHPAPASRQKTEKIASKHKTRFVARKIAKLMFHFITQLADRATNLPSPNDERKEPKSEKGQGRKTSTIDSNTAYLRPSIIHCQF